ncbi:cleavage stimulation factor subunit 2 tau variant [Acyrthosiphon pisum]|uniref:RRM domain-containing protein n=1 Tax=Acyrthosiphon pisum TaxID=7029 RepID=A0A8R2H9D5_ACYPI|nr:cleavage stimulation factor subunit 2 tau variant [Acyrthosiphon pisum]XP_016662274.1 cleavage stimulation factor subunit 2 tau variant [Acyrthosiphon pisum]|eukprot:XP_008185936.1 PREDICTED: cleavage stimulation factor subunit 2 tau variant [Acyrthosiphon pisum]
MTEQNILDKSMRSVFVGNIPYEATEEKLKDIFNEVGPVISFKLVYDRETGKPKGYGFCEYKDQETALSAMRNLNGYEIGGRTLRVDNACTEKSRLEMQSLMMGMPTSESHYGDAVNAEKAPEIINNVVSTLPPEQLYELMKQMKECIQNNPAEARNMLLQNPQLGYALLQAQVIMKIVDPEVAKTMLHPVHKVPQSPRIPNAAPTTSRVQPVIQTTNNENIDWQHNNMYCGQSTSQDLRQPPPNQMPFLPPPPPLLSNIEPPPSFMATRDYPRTSAMDSDQRSFGDMYLDHRANNNFMTMPPPMIVQQPIASEQKVPPRIIPSSQPQPQPQPQQAPNQIVKTSDSEKAALIMQVLQLTDAQIAKLPQEQRQSILQLKEKISNSNKKKD